MYSWIASRDRNSARYCPSQLLKQRISSSGLTHSPRPPPHLLSCSCLSDQELLYPNPAHPRCFDLELRVLPSVSRGIVLPGAHPCDCQASASSMDLGGSHGPSSAPCPSFPNHKST